MPSCFTGLVSPAGYLSAAPRRGDQTPQLEVFGLFVVSAQNLNWPPSGLRVTLSRALSRMPIRELVIGKTIWVNVERRACCPFSYSSGNVTESREDNRSLRDCCTAVTGHLTIAGCAEVISRDLSSGDGSVTLCPRHIRGGISPAAGGAFISSSTHNLPSRVNASGGMRLHFRWSKPSRTLPILPRAGCSLV